MTNLEEKLNTLKLIRLPDEERLRMREELLAYAELHAGTVQSTAQHIFHTFTMRLYAGLAAVVFLFISVGGTALASNSAMPGDALYSVKVNVTEPIQTALVPSDHGKAAWHAILAERRLEEAAQLAAQNNLSSSTQAQLSANFSEQVSASLSDADRLQSSGDMVGSLSVRSDLEARIAAHEQILGVIASHYAMASTTDSAGTQLALRSFLDIVHAHEGSVSTSRIALQDSLSPMASTTATIAVATPDQANDTAAPAMKAHGHMTLQARVESTDEARTMEVASIIENHASMLAKFLPAATTTQATSTEETAATSTSATTTEVTATSSPSIDIEGE